MAVTMNKDVLKGKWKQVRGKVRQHWGKLRNNQLDQIGGRYEGLVGLIQEKYGYTRVKARREVDQFLHRHTDTHARNGR